MPRYHFNLHDHRYVPDIEGSELNDFDAAKRRTIKFGAAILAGQPDEFLGATEWRVEVTDQSGVILFAVAWI